MSERVQTAIAIAGGFLLGSLLLAFVYWAHVTEAAADERHMRLDVLRICLEKHTVAECKELGR